MRNDYRDRLFALQDKEYAKFMIKLTPGLSEESVIGVRNPKSRALAKAILKEGNYFDFLHDLPHKYFDEYMLHGLIISGIKDYKTAVEEMDRFLPYVDNWAVCDTTSPNVFKKYKKELLTEIKRWTSSKHTYTCRFGLEMLMSFYLDDDFSPELLEIPASVRSDEYYVRMMVAWFFATALAKQWEATFPYITTQRMDDWTHNKTIQKARESFRITDEQKELLNSYKVTKKK